MHRPASQVAHELAACIRCNECLAACPALATPITIETLNRQTLDNNLPEDAFYGDTDEEEGYQTRNRADAYTAQSWAARGWYEDFED
jgi:ferredoxin